MKNVLNLFARKVKDAQSDEEVKELVETTDAVLTEEADKVQDELSDNTEQKILEVLLELSTVLKDMRAKAPVPDAEPTVETKEEEVISNDEDPAMSELNKLEDACKDEETEEVKDEGAEEDVITEDEERPIEEVVESSRENITDDDGHVPEDKNTFEKIVKDMKPVLAKITDSKERKMVCDALAKSLGGAKKSSNGYGNIMKSMSTKVVDSSYIGGDDAQSFYDSLNPHKKNNQ